MTLTIGFSYLLFHKIAIIIVSIDDYPVGHAVHKVRADVYKRIRKGSPSYTCIYHM